MRNDRSRFISEAFTLATFTTLTTQIVNSTTAQQNSLLSGGEFVGHFQDLGNVLADFAEVIWSILDAEQQ